MTPTPDFVSQCEQAARELRDPLEFNNHGLANLYAPTRYQLADLLTAAAAMARDAERYRWLRTQHWSEQPAMCVVRNPKYYVNLAADCPSTERLDAAIDAARSEK